MLAWCRRRAVMEFVTFVAGLLAVALPLHRTSCDGHRHGGKGGGIEVCAHTHTHEQPQGTSAAGEQPAGTLPSTPPEPDGGDPAEDDCPICLLLGWQVAAPAPVAGPWLAQHGAIRIVAPAWGEPRTVRWHVPPQRGPPRG